tara:strand:- start:1103 stop:1975 length:873 start_codon:yes stop_codon:yes gene_type:complete
MSKKKVKSFLLSERKKNNSSLQERIFYFFISKILFFREAFYLCINRSKFKKIIIKKKPLISVITPTYNRSSILVSRAVKSVLNQSYKNFEYIIVGDGCTDDTKNKLSKIKDKRVKFFNIERKILYKKNIHNLWFAGPVRALNFALKKSKGDWVARIDDDIIWKKDHLEKSLNFCKKNKLEFLTSAAYSERFKKRIVTKYEIINKKKIGGSNTFFFISYLKFFKFNIFCWMKKINRVNDVDFFERITNLKVKTGFRDKPSMLNLPRPKETTLGIDQIILKKKSYEKKYFNK